MDAETFRRPSHLITRSARLLTRRGEEQLAASGLAVAQVPVLFALQGGRSLTQKELAHLARIEQPTMTLLLARMERDGLVQRTPHPDDKRSSLVSLTPLALSRLPEAKAALLEGNAAALQGFTEEEVAALSRLLRRVVNNLDPDAAEIEREWGR